MQSPPASPWPRRTLWWVFAVAGVVYGASLFAPFYYDDVHSVAKNPHLKLENTLAFFHDPSLFDENPRTRMYRPVLLVSYAIDDCFWGRNPLGFHLTNLLLHFGVVFVLFRFLQAVLPVGRSMQSTTRRDWAAVIGAGAFALHPLASEGIIYVSCRSSLLATLGYVGALLCTVRARDAAGGRRLQWLGAAAVWAVVAFGSKAIAITLPAAAILVDLAVARSRRIAGEPHAGGAADVGASTWVGRTIGLVLRVAPLAILAMAYLVVRSKVMGSTGVNVSAERFYESSGHALTGGRSVLANLFTQAFVFWHYVQLIVFPGDLNIAHHVAVLTKFADPRVWASVVGLGVGAVVAICCWRRHPWITVALAWMPLTLSPTSSIIPLNVIMNEHRMYLPLSLTLGIAVAYAVLRLARTSEGAAPLPRPVVITVCVVLGVLSLRTGFRSLDYLNARTLWGKAVAAAPGNFRARNYFGNALVADGDLLGAREQYRAAAAIYPDQFDTRINLGEVTLRIAETGLDRSAWHRCEEIFRGVIADEPRHVLARLKLGRFLVKRGERFGSERDHDAADEMFRSVVKIARGERFKDYRVWAWARISRLDEKRGRLEDAVDGVLEVLKIAPGNAGAKGRLKRLRGLMEARGSLD